MKRTTRLAVVASMALLPAPLALRCTPPRSYSVPKPKHHLHHVRRPCGGGHRGLWRPAGKALNPTPTLDKLAKEGMLM